MSLPCPTCAAPLTPAGDRLACEQQHAFTADGLTLASNLAAVNALWLAIRALEDDAACLDWRIRTGQTGDHALYAEQAAAGRAAAQHLRKMAQAAQARLDQLPAPPSSLHLVSSRDEPEPDVTGDTREQ